MPVRVEEWRCLECGERYITEEEAAACEGYEKGLREEAKRADRRLRRQEKKPAFQIIEDMEAS